MKDFVEIVCLEISQKANPLPENMDVLTISVPPCIFQLQIFVSSVLWSVHIARLDDAKYSGAKICSCKFYIIDLRQKNEYIIFKSMKIYSYCPKTVISALLQIPTRLQTY